VEIVGLGEEKGLRDVLTRGNGVLERHQAVSKNGNGKQKGEKK